MPAHGQFQMSIDTPPGRDDDGGVVQEPVEDADGGGLLG
jgi:hypothetical protein